MKDSRLIGSFKPWTKDKGVMLGPYVTVVGIMQVGKTTTINDIVYEINETYPVHQVNVNAKSFQEVFRIHETDLVPKLQKADMINVFVDDTIKSMHSKKHNVEAEQNWYSVRHYFEEQIELKAVTINFFFVTQRYKTLSNALRQAPILIFKPTVIRDEIEEMFFNIVIGREATDKIKKWLTSLYIDKREGALKKAYVKYGDDEPCEFTFTSTRTPVWEYIDLPEEDSNGKLKPQEIIHNYDLDIIERALRKGMLQKDIAILIGKSIQTVSKDVKKLRQQGRIGDT